MAHHHTPTSARIRVCFRPELTHTQLAYICLPARPSCIGTRMHVLMCMLVFDHNLAWHVLEWGIATYKVGH